MDAGGPARRQVIDRRRGRVHDGHAGSCNPSSTGVRRLVRRPLECRQLRTRRPRRARDPAGATRWKSLNFRLSAEAVYLRWRTTDESPSELYTATIDQNARKISLTPYRAEPATQPTPTIVLRYERVDANHLKLDGKVGAETLAMQLERVTPGTNLLMTRGFHWINETPFSR
jgi:hypothetical protein